MQTTRTLAFIACELLIFIAGAVAVCLRYGGEDGGFF